MIQIVDETRVVDKGTFMGRHNAMLECHTTWDRVISGCPPSAFCGHEQGKECSSDRLFAVIYPAQRVVATRSRPFPCPYWRGRSDADAAGLTTSSLAALPRISEGSKIISTGRYRSAVKTSLAP